MKSYSGMTIVIDDNTVCDDAVYEDCTIVIDTTHPKIHECMFVGCSVNIFEAINLRECAIRRTSFHDCYFSIGALHQLAAAVLYSQAYEERGQLLDTHATFISKASIALAVQHFTRCCWLDFLAVEHPHRAWAIETLRQAFPEEHHLQQLPGERQ